MMFWDASAVIPLCVTEKVSEAIKRLLMADPLMAVWWATPVECCSAFARLRREAILGTEEERLAKEPLYELMKVATEIKPSQKVRDHALRLIATHPLRSADALQLAAALIWTNNNPHGYSFVCLDKKLRIAAQKEGFTIVPEKAVC
jgi:uncharacterized protein